MNMTIIRNGMKIKPNINSTKTTTKSKDPFRRDQLIDIVSGLGWRKRGIEPLLAHGEVQQCSPLDRLVKTGFCRGWCDEMKPRRNNSRLNLWLYFH